MPIKKHFFFLKKSFYFLIEFFNLEKIKPQYIEDFPGGPVIKNLPANAGDKSSVPGLERVHMPWGN